MSRHAKLSTRRPTTGAPRCCLLLFALATAIAAFAPAAHASKQAIDFFGGSGTLGGQFTDPSSVTVNDSGAGPANAGDLYAIDSSNHRIQRFGRDDNGTPADTADDIYFFISAWGADVSLPSGGSDYEICTVAAECQTAVASPGNGTAAGNGALGSLSSSSNGIALDQDTGNVFVTDAGSTLALANNRVNVYDGVGNFLYSFGFDVVTSGPGNRGTGYEVCVAANGDICKAGVTGNGAGQVGFTGIGPGHGPRNASGIAVSAPDGNPATGTVFLADSANNRVNTYSLDGLAPASIGSAAVFRSGTNSYPTSVAVDSHGILYASNAEPTPTTTSDHRIMRYDTVNANGGGVGFLTPLLAPFNEFQQLNRNASAGQFRLSFGADTTADLNFNATESQVDAALESLPSIGAGNVSVSPCNCADAYYTIRFTGALANTDVAELVVSNGTTPLTGTISVRTWVDGHGGALDQNSTSGLAVDPDTDGGGPDTDILYAGRGSIVQQFGPLNPPGLSAPPSAEDDRHNTNGVASSPGGIAVEPATGRLYAASGGEAGPGVYVIDNTGPPPTASLNSCDNIAATSADCHATIDPNGPPATRYHFEYSTDGVRWLSTPEVFLGTQTDPQAIDETVEPEPIGLQPNTRYHVRILAVRRFADPVISNELTFTTTGAPPIVETAGAPVRTTTTAQLNGRLVPRNSATTYHFEYGDQGPCDSNPCASTPNLAAGSDDLTKLVAEELTGLQPDTTYHYRLVADNGVGSPVSGADMTVKTRASDTLPNQSDEFPGPPGSDRAWEQVSIAESSGNPIAIFYPTAFSEDGDRAVYGIAGGTPIGPVGSFVSPYFAQRTPKGWQTIPFLPPRDQLVGQEWFPIQGSHDLSTTVLANRGSDSGVEEFEYWRLTPSFGPTLLHRAPIGGGLSIGVSADGSRAVGFIDDAPDPAYPAVTQTHIYDLSSTAPQLLSLLPGDVPSPCPTGGLSPGVASDGHWVSEDGSLVYFETDPTAPCNTPQLYARDVLAGETGLISGPPLSGPDCGGSFVKSIPGAAFLATSSRLDPDDAEPANCSGSGANDVYRYDTGDGSLQCLTCVAPGFAAGVEGDDPSDIAVAEDGSRIYFTTRRRLLPGAPPDGQRGIYRLDVKSGGLAFVAPIGTNDRFGTASTSVALSADGLTLVFASAEASLNPLGGVSDNDGGTQYYRYEDTDRSLICASCPLDGSAPLEEVDGTLHRFEAGLLNNRALSADGSTFAFATVTPLLGADQNTPGGGQDLDSGRDIYEWRDGRHILVTDGLTRWVVPPLVEGVGPSGTDIFFDAAAAYTPDAPDALLRLYTARIGGGIEFPEPPPPCPLEVCQGTPRGAPDDPFPGTPDFAGRGNLEAQPANTCGRFSKQAARKLAAARGAQGEEARQLRRQARNLKRRAARCSRRAAR